MAAVGNTLMGRARRISSLFRLTPIPTLAGNRRQSTVQNPAAGGGVLASLQEAEGTALTDTVTDGEVVEGDGFVFRVGPGCILGGGVLASLLGVEGAVEWKDEVRNGAPNVGCEAGATAIAATERYG